MGKLKVILLPEKSSLYSFYFWRYRVFFEQIVLTRLVRKYCPVLIHLHVVYGFAEETCYLKERFGLPFIISEHMGPFPFNWLSDKEKLIIKPVKEAAKVIAVSTAQAQQILFTTGTEAVVIPNVVRTSDFYYLRLPMMRNDNTLHIVFTGIYTKAKGADYLIRAYAEFVKKYPDSVLHLVGGATTERIRELQTLIAETGSSSTIKFEGNLTSAALNKLYNECDFYVCSSEWESFGLSVLEALFTGLPVLCTDCGGVSDFITTDNGIIIYNDRQVVTLLKGLYQMKQDYIRFNRKQITETIQRKFSSAIVQQRYLAIYQSILNTNADTKAA